MKDEREIADIASYVERTHDLDDGDKLAIMLEWLPVSGVRPEVSAYIREALENIVAKAAEDLRAVARGLSGAHAAYPRANPDAE